MGKKGERRKVENEVVSNSSIQNTSALKFRGVDDETGDKHELFEVLRMPSRCVFLKVFMLFLHHSTSSCHSFPESFKYSSEWFVYNSKNLTIACIDPTLTSFKSHGNVAFNAHYVIFTCLQLLLFVLHGNFLSCLKTNLKHKYHKTSSTWIYQTFHLSHIFTTITSYPVLNHN